MRAGRPAAIAALSLAVCACAHPAHALGVRYPDHVAVASGTRVDVVAALTSAPAVWSVEVSDRVLFGDVGLRVTGVRGALVRKAWHAGVEAAQMSAGVGRETRVAARVGTTGVRWRIAAEVASDDAEIADAAPARLVTVGVRTAVSALDHVSVGCDVDGFRVAGIEHPGADVETSVTVLAGGVAVTTALVVDRTVGAHARVSAAVRVNEGAVVVAGYDDESASLSIALAVAAKRARGVVGASAHPVLGLSRGVSVGWAR